MAEVIFNYEGTIISIQCDINDKMENVINKFLLKIEKQENNNFYYLYNGSNLTYHL